MVDQGYFFKVITNLNDIDVKHIISENKISKEEVENYMQKTLSEIKGVTNIEEESITDEDFVDVEMDDIKIRQNRDDESISEYDGYYEDEYYEEDNMQVD